LIIYLLQYYLKIFKIYTILKALQIFYFLNIIFTIISNYLIDDFILYKFIYIITLNQVQIHLKIHNKQNLLIHYIQLFYYY
jgi:hypothetical protein